MLVFIVDINSEDIKAEYKALCNELKTYNKSLLKKPKILLLTKLDAKHNDNKVPSIPKINSIQISAIARDGLQESIDAIYDLLQTA